MRDNFTAKTKRTLAARVGYHCSNPGCACSTSGPAIDEGGEVNIGVAAHIAAAEKGGKRYDENMTPAERSSGNNGIWLCQSCSKLIDSDEGRYTEALLHRWKKDAVKRAQEAISGGRTLGNIRPDAEPDEADTEFLRGLDLPGADAVDAVTARLRAAAAVDVAHFRDEHGRPRRTLALTLRLRRSTIPEATLEGVARLTQLAEPISLLAPGGTGKSTTLIQIAEKLLADGGPVPLLVPLGDWANRQEDFFAAVRRRPPFGAFRNQHLMQLAYQGRLVLLLDGWNELSADARLRATEDFAALQRDYPQLGFVISSRRNALPVDGPVIEIDELSQDQQVELARALRGDEGVALLDRAARTSGVRELVRVPLYLSALLALPPGEPFPETKEAVLRMFVQQSVATPARAERLRRDTLGHHQTLLTALAVTATRTANTSISNVNANLAVSRTIQRLADAGQIQIGGAPQPSDMVDGLVNAHLLVREHGADGSVRFQHPLFQEWFAAADVERFMLESGAGNAESRRRLREEILNWSSWEESILFSCDRLSRVDDNGIRAVAAAVDAALAIDPLLAAAMLNRASDAVWHQLRNRVLALVRRWHRPGIFDRAVRFMITSGKPEFADYIWPLVGNADDQVQFETLRAASPFRPSVLGADREARLRALPTPQRKLALPEIASNSGFDGMELATAIAASDPDAEVVVSVVESLAFRRGDRHVNQIMRTAPELVWSGLAREGYPAHLTDADLNTRLTREREKVRAEGGNPIRDLGHLIEDRTADVEARITALIADADVNFRDNHFEHAIARAYGVYPGAVSAGIAARVVSDKSLPFRAGRYLRDAPLIDQGPTAEAALDPATPENRLLALSAILGPTTVAALFDQLFEIDGRLQGLGRYDETLSNAAQRLVRALGSVRQDVFVPVFVEKARTEDNRRIAALGDLFARYGDEHGSNKEAIDERYVAALREVLARWAGHLVQAPDFERHTASEVVRAIGRLADPALARPLREMLDRCLRAYAEARAAQAAAQGGVINVPVGYHMIYARAFAAIGGAESAGILINDLERLDWGVEAAGTLYDIWTARHPPDGDRRFASWHNFSRRPDKLAERANGTPPTSDFAEAIFAVVRRMGQAERPEAEQRHAIALATRGLGLPHGSKRAELDVLLALPRPTAEKQCLLLAAALAGEIVPAELVLEGLRDLLDAAQAQPWRLDDSRGELMSWIELFPFSDAPERVHEAIALLPERRRLPTPLHRLVEALPNGPADSALQMVRQLAANNPVFFRDHGWAHALMQIPGERAALALIEYLCAGQLPPGDGIRISRTLVAAAKQYAAVRAEMIARYRDSATGAARQVLGMAMDEMPDEEIFMALFDTHVGAANPMNFLRNAIWNLAVGQKTVDDSSGAFEEFGQPLTGLRARLFAMLPGNDARAALAKECLIAIDGVRDQRGRINDEPRHPDISSGRAWPPEAEEPSA